MQLDTRDTRHATHRGENSYSGIDSGMKLDTRDLKGIGSLQTQKESAPRGCWNMTSNGITNDNGTTAPNLEKDAICVGRLVEVESRTWPGINKPGGVGRVTALHFDDNQVPTHVDVTYMVGRSKEKRVPLDYVNLAPEYEVSSSRRANQAIVGQGSLRDRSLLLGRCRRCGSLRTDCGSCDWATEEEEQRCQQTTTHKRQSRGLTKPKDFPPDSDSESVSSDEQEDLVLHELLQKNKRRYRTYLRHRARWNAITEDSSTDQGDASKAEKVGNTKSSKKPTEHNQQPLRPSSQPVESMEESDVDDDLDEWLNQSQLRYQRYLRRRAVWNRHLPGHQTEGKEIRKASRRLINNGPSVLELAATNLTVEQTGNLEKDRQSASKPQKRGGYRQVAMEGAETRHADDKAGISSPPSQRPVAVDSPVGVTEASSPESTPAQFHLSSPLDSHEISPFSDTELQIPNVDESDDEVLNDSQGSHGLTLSQFIQPEGLEAANSLPQDTKDRTKAIPYPDLPNFFDSMASRIEDEWLPDFKLQIAECQRQWRNLGSDSNSLQRSDSDRNAKAMEVLRNCQTLWRQMRKDLIRNGTDQCRAALRQLMDDRMYRKQRNRLTAQQRKQCRGAGLMDVRNLRMDAVDEAVESVVKTLLDLADSCEGFTDMVSAESYNDTMDETNSLSEEGEHSELDYETQELIPASEVGGEPALDPSERPLGPFDPHMHAVRKRAQTATTRKRTRNVRSNSTGRSCKRRVQSTSAPHRTEVRFSTNATPSMERSASTAARKASEDEAPPTDPAPRRPEPNDVNQPFHEADTPGISESSGSNNPNAHDDDDDVPTFGLFDTEPESFPIPTSEEPRVASGRTSRQRRPQRMESSHQRSVNERIPRQRVPISQRMQAFLDANAHLGTSWREEQSEVEEKSSNAVNARKRRRPRPSSSPPAYRHTPTVEGNPGRNQRPSPQLDQFESTETEFVEGSSGTELQSQEYPGVLSVDFVFSRFKEGSRDTAVVSPEIAPGDDATVICSELERCYPIDPGRCTQLLDRLRPIIAEDEGGTAGAAFLTSAVEILHTHGCSTLQELIANKSLHLVVHVRILAEMARAVPLVQRFNGDGPIYDDRVATLLSSQREFNNFLVLQLVDAVLGILHPCAWALQIDNRPAVLDIISILRDELSSLLPLTEWACRCIVEQLECQQWRVSNRQSSAFVSCIDPRDWERFLESGKFPEKPSETRFSKLGKMWPRVEVESLWGLLAYVGARSPHMDDKTHQRWHVVSRLFSCSVLAGCSSPEQALPPSEAQLSTCSKEVGFLARLLSQGAMYSVPNSESVLVSLLKRSVMLQADDYSGNPLSRSSIFPEFRDTKREKKIASRLWKATQHKTSVGHDVATCHEYKFFEVKYERTVEGCGIDIKELLLPSSSILCQCLWLVSAWIRRVPCKKVRLTRLSKQLKSLTDSLMAASVGNETTPPANPSSDAFARAFSATAVVDAGNGAERKALFLREAVCLLKLTVAASKDIMKQGAGEGPGPGSFNHDLICQLWKIMGNNNLEERQRAISAGGERPGQFKEDSYRLFLAARVMATVSLVGLSLLPWNLSDGRRLHKLSNGAVGFHQETHQSDFYTFPISCIFACLDGACDLEGASAIMAHLYSMITLVFNNMASLVSIDGTNPAIEDVARMCQGSFSAVLLRCFKVHINSGGQPEGGLLLRLFFCSLRGMISFQRSVMQKGPVHDESVRDGDRGAGPNSNGGADEDLWGSLDDSLLASIDLGAPVTATCDDVHRTEGLWKTLASALHQSKPSERFKIQAVNISDEVVDMSAQGKHLIAKQADKVSACLVALAATEKMPTYSTGLWLEFSSWFRVYHANEMDMQFETRVARVIAEELCSLAPTNAVCREFAVASCEPFVFSLLENLLDSNRLELYPSCNVGRIRDSAGDECARTALALLELFNDDSPITRRGQETPELRVLSEKQRSRRVRADSCWKFCEVMGTAISVGDKVNGHVSGRPANLGDVLLQNDADITAVYTETLDKLSLERETTHCFRLIRNLVSASANRTPQVPALERLCAFILKVMATQLLQIAQSEKYHNQSSSIAIPQDNESVHRRAQLRELASCYCDLFVATVGWILRENLPNGTSQWESLLRSLRERLLSPVLRAQPIDLTVSLQRVVVEADRVLSGYGEGNDVACPGIPGCGNFLEGMFHKIVRRGRQLLLASAKSPMYVGIQSALVEATLACDEEREDEVARLVGASFKAGSLERNRLPQNPLETELDSYLQFVENGLSSELRLEAEIDATKTQFVGMLLLPRTIQKSRPVEQKRRVLRLLGYVLENGVVMASLDDASATGRDTMCYLAHGLWVSLSQCLKKPTVDDNMIGVAFACATTMANLGIDGRCVSGEGRLFNWSRTVVNSIGDKHVCDFSQREANAAYMWVFFEWLRSFCSILVTKQHCCLEGIREFRRTFADEKEWDQSLFATIFHQEASLASLTDALWCIDDHVFPSRSENNIVNVYANMGRNDASTEEHSLNNWQPSNTVKRLSKEFMATIVAMS